MTRQSHLKVVLTCIVGILGMEIVGIDIDGIEILGIELGNSMCKRSLKIK